MSPIPRIKAAKVAPKGGLTDRKRRAGPIRRGGDQRSRAAGPPEGNRAISLMGSGIVRARRWARPVGIHPIEKSARKGFLGIAFSSAGNPTLPSPAFGEGRVGVADYVAEDGATQMVDLFC